MFLGDIWSAQNSKTFELCLSVRPSVRHMDTWTQGHMGPPIHTTCDIYSCIPTLNNTNKNYPHRYTGSGTSHISQIGILGSWGHGTSTHTKFHIWAYTPTLNNNTKNYPHRYTGSGTSHISHTSILVSWAHGKSDSHQISYLCLYTNSK